MLVFCTITYTYTTLAIGYKSHAKAHSAGHNGSADVEEGAY